MFHYEGYKMFLDEITNSTKYPDVFIVPIEAGIKYMQNPLPMAVLDNYGKDDRSPFGCQSIEDQTGKYEEHRCGGSQSCQFQVDIDSDNIHETRCSHSHLALLSPRCSGT